MKFLKIYFHDSIVCWGASKIAAKFRKKPLKFLATFFKLRKHIKNERKKQNLHAPKFDTLL